MEPARSLRSVRCRTHAGGGVARSRRHDIVCARLCAGGQTAAHLQRNVGASNPVAYTMLHRMKAMNADARRLGVKCVARSLDTLVAIAFPVGAAGPARAAKSMPHPPTDTLSQTSGIAEQVSENAPSIDAVTFSKAMSDIDALGIRLFKAQSPERKKILDGLVTGMRSA